VDHQVRRAIALLERFTHDQHVGDLCRVSFAAVKRCRDEANAAQGFDQPESAERLHCICSELNAGADWGELWRLFVDLDAEAKSQQACCQREPANAGADDRDVSFLCRHRFPFGCEIDAPVRHWIG
jgi:hypothetical protein